MSNELSSRGRRVRRVVGVRPRDLGPRLDRDRLGGVLEVGDLDLLAALAGADAGALALGLAAALGVGLESESSEPHPEATAPAASARAGGEQRDLAPWPHDFT